MPDKTTLENVFESFEPIQVVDLFAGPGGLGEGFSSLRGGKFFQIIASAEMDSVAHRTLRLRAFYRLLRSRNRECLSDYYSYCNGETATPWSARSESEWEDACEEARCITLGTEAGDNELDAILDDKLDQSKPWVLIGGPPCQAYSLAGRSRNMGKANYTPEQDHRHFLYRDYLRIIQERKPTVFVMENVKGILSSKIDGESIFLKILEDLGDPDRALDVTGSGQKYHICSLVTDQVFTSGSEKSIDPREFIIRMEDHGIPQARHRVILLGIAIDGDKPPPDYKRLKKLSSYISTSAVLSGLPKIRSRLTQQHDGDDEWRGVVEAQYQAIAAGLKSFPAGADNGLLSKLEEFKDGFAQASLTVGNNRVPRVPGDGIVDEGHLDRWYVDDRLKFWLNHDARGNMASDLRRYLYASLFASCRGYSPKGHKEFNLPGLAPAHKNWESGKFSDRFRVQCAHIPSTTVTSHLSKDGHYFIHYDPLQCRSLSVREAARLQTFPDNYLFEGHRSQQYHQVGNAVPPLLAKKIALIVSEIFSSNYMI